MAQSTEDIFEHLHREHEEVSRLVQLIKNNRGAEKRGELFERLKGALLLHSQVEEAVFYKELRVYEQLEDLIAEAQQEHEEVECILEEMAEVDPQGEEFNDLIDELEDNLRHHVSEEEGEIFELARAVLTPDQVKALARQFEEEEQQRKAA